MLSPNYAIYSYLTPHAFMRPLSALVMYKTAQSIDLSKLYEYYKLLWYSTHKLLTRVQQLIVRDYVESQLQSAIIC